MEEVIKIFTALADETRLRILNILTLRACSGKEIIRILKISQTRVSRNLGMLKDVGFLNSEQRGTQVYYFLNEEEGSCFTAGVRELMVELVVRDDVIRADRLRLRNMFRKRIDVE